MEGALIIPKYAALIICTILSFVPIFVWGYIFLKKNPKRKKIVLITFIGGIVSVTPLLVYKYLWQFFPWINAFLWTRNLNADLLGLSDLIFIPVPVLVTFMVVGIIEEMSKIFAVRLADNNLLKDIEDAISLSIIAALGFAFIENIIYFYNISLIRGVDQLGGPFIFRSLFSTFAHVMFSGIFGYYYGLAHFADPVYREESRKKRHPLIKWIHKRLHFKKEVLFRDEKILEGLLVASGLHALFNIFLEMGWSFLIVPYLFGGYLVLTYLLKKKENLKTYGKLSSQGVDA
ncbi:PrsW family intramembrane metalloprotease [Candidatus Peregrinibacteria bacterium]|nr:PrsW family intramembrane metalloprotease [Candidatus Peregrinibacteria bacterium]